MELPRRAEARGVEIEYLAKLAEDIRYKRGHALAVSLDTLISRGPQPAAPAVVQSLMENFAELPEMMQRALLTSEWSRIASPSIASFLGKLATGSGPARDAALVHLEELDPAAARGIKLDRIRHGDVIRNSPAAEPRVLLTLPESTRPDLDAPLLTALEQGKPVDLLVARYASEAVLPRVRAILEGGRVICGSPLLAYLFRVDDAGAAELLNGVRARQPGGCQLNFSSYEDLLMSPGLERQAIADLSNADPLTRRSAETLLQYGGSPQAEQPLWEALSQLRDHQPQPLDSNEFGLMEALSKAAGWTLTAAEIDRLVAACATDSCRNQASAVHHWLAEPISISVDDITYVRLGLFMLRSRAQLEQKIAQFPKATRFFIQASQGTWYGDQRRKEIREMLEKAGMRVVDPPSTQTVQ